MGFKSRERKRKRRAATRAAQTTARVSGSSAGKWWLTIAIRDGCCARCAGVQRVGHEIVYRHSPRVVLCLLCAESDLPVKPRPSLRWEREHGRRRRAARRRR
jgi:hypothetical protein